MAMNSQGLMTSSGVPPRAFDPLDQTVWVGNLCTNVRTILEWKRKAEQHFALRSSMLRIYERARHIPMGEEGSDQYNHIEFIIDEAKDAIRSTVAA